jgi:3-oxoadipate enol-lactonase
VDVATKLGRLAVTDSGTGTPVVFWHSLLCDSSMWNAQVDELGRDHRILRVEGPGHGRSEPCHRPFTIEQCADALVEILDAHAIEKATLVGLSWGGMTAMRVAIRAPSRVAALALLDTSASAEYWKNRVRYRAMAEVYRRIGLVAPILPAVADAMFTPETLRARPFLFRELVSRIRLWDRDGLYHAIKAVVVERVSIVAQLPRIRVPVLVVVGAKDKATPPRESERIAASIEGARLERVEGAGHLSAVERPEEVNRLLRAFVSGL